MKDPYTEKFRTLVKETKEDTERFSIFRNKIVKMFILPPKPSLDLV